MKGGYRKCVLLFLLCGIMIIIHTYIFSQTWIWKKGRTTVLATPKISSSLSDGRDTYEEAKQKGEIKREKEEKRKQQKEAPVNKDFSHLYLNGENKKSLKVSIHIFAWKRAKSLKRLGDSLLKANYYGYKIPIYFYVDGNPLEQVVSYVKDFIWPHGEKIVTLREKELGMPGSIINGWQPVDDDEYGILLEDDLEVSESFFEFALYYLYFEEEKRKVEGDDNGMIGCSFYTPRANQIYTRSLKVWDPRKTIGFFNHIFYFQLPCSWGAMYNARYWKEFLRYFEIRDKIGDESFPPIPNARSNTWKKSWKRYLIDLMLFRGWYMLYPSFPDQASFSTNHMEMGIHSVKGNNPTNIPDELGRGDKKFTVPLLKGTEFRSFLPMPSPMVIKKVPLISLYHQRVFDRFHLYLDFQPFLKKLKNPELDAFLLSEARINNPTGNADNTKVIKHQKIDME